MFRWRLSGYQSWGLSSNVSRMVTHCSISVAADVLGGCWPSPIKWLASSFALHFKKITYEKIFHPWRWRHLYEHNKIYSNLLYHSMRRISLTSITLFQFVLSLLNCISKKKNIKTVLLKVCFLHHLIKLIPFFLMLIEKI